MISKRYKELPRETRMLKADKTGKKWVDDIYDALNHEETERRIREVMEERGEMDTDTEQSQYVILAVIIIVAIAAAIYYMKGYKR